MLLLDDLLLAPGTAVMKIFEELARKAQEEFLDDGPVKKELQEIYALLESGSLSEADFATREQQLLQRLAQIAGMACAPPAEDMGPADSGSVRGVLPPAPDFTAIDAPSLELPTLELPPAAFSRVEFPPLTATTVITPAPPPEPAHAVPSPVPVHAVADPPVSVPPPAAAVIPESPKEAPPVKLTPAQVVESALRGLAMLKMRVSAVTAVTRVANGWQVVAELIESRAVPDTSDLLGVYEMQLDEAGNILGYMRTRMRRRCDLGDRR